MAKPPSHRAQPSAPSSAGPCVAFLREPSPECCCFERHKQRQTTLLSHLDGEENVQKRSPALMSARSWGTSEISASLRGELCSALPAAAAPSFLERICRCLQTSGPAVAVAPARTLVLEPLTNPVSAQFNSSITWSNEQREPLDGEDLESKELSQARRRTRAALALLWRGPGRYVTFMGSFISYPSHCCPSCFPAVNSGSRVGIYCRTRGLFAGGEVGACCRQGSQGARASKGRSPALPRGCGGASVSHCTFSSTRQPGAFL